MREKITKNRKYILMVLGILILSTLYVGMKYLMRPKYEPLPVVKLKDKETNKKKFAVMVQNGDSYEEYTSEDGTWPSEEEGYEFKEAKCIDNNGALVNNAVTFANGKVTLKTNKTIYCTLYFDEKAKTTIQLLRENDPQNKLSSDKVGEMYRFQGKNTDTINNYICFGTDNKEDCTKDDTNYDKYMYRIIGITEDGELYLIKMKGLESSGSKTFSWDTGCYGEIPTTWPYAKISDMLNGTSSSSNIFVKNSRYEYMVEGNDWYNKIESHDWKYGYITDTSNNGITIYNTENAWSSYITTKIGSMYVHDYYLAYDNNRNWSSDYDTSNWIHFVNNKNTTGSSTELLLASYKSVSCTYSTGTCPPSDPIETGGWGPADPAEPENPGVAFIPSSSIDFKIVDSMELKENENSNKIVRTATCQGNRGVCNVVSSTGKVGNVDYNGLVRPTFYLSSSVKIKSGTGSITDPYIIQK